MNDIGFLFMRKAIQEIYKNRQSFIVVGLTGKIGSGCTTAADFLSSDISGHSLSDIKLSCDSKDTDRKEFIVQNFYKTRWEKFTKITVSDVMTHVLMKSNFNEIKNLLVETYIEYIISGDLEKSIAQANSDTKESILEPKKKTLLNKSLPLKKAFKMAYLEYRELGHHEVDFKVINSMDSFSELQEEHQSFEDKAKNLKLEIKSFDEEIKCLFKMLLAERIETYVDIKALEAFHSKYVIKFQDMEKKTVEVKEEGSNQNADKVLQAYEYIVDSLPEFSKQFKDILQKKRYRTYTLIYQKLGDNLRKFGAVSLLGSNCKESPGNIYFLSEVINRFIKVIRKRNKASGASTFIVVDSFRNTMEAMFFKERYAGFYLFSINAKDSDIKHRLIKNSSMTEDEIKKQSSKEEDVEPLKSMDYFTSQGVRDCIQKADIHISNNNDDHGNKDFLYRQIIKFVSLVQHPGLITPSEDEKMMQIAYTAKLNSGCLSRQVGAAVTNSSGSLMAIGWNSVAEGQTPCLLRNKVELIDLVANTPENIKKSNVYSSFEKTEAFSDALQQYSAPISQDETKYQPAFEGLNQSFCFKSVYNEHQGDNNQVHTRSLHAEENAFLQISKYGGEGVKGGVLYSTASPCELCSKKAYQLGIKKVIYIDPYPGIAESQILNVGTEIPEMALFNGAIGSAYHRLYEQVIPYKDEIKAYSTDKCC